jgi:hypothetical protein
VCSGAKLFTTWQSGCKGRVRGRDWVENANFKTMSPGTYFLWWGPFLLKFSLPLNNPLCYECIDRLLYWWVEPLWSNHFLKATPLNTAALGTNDLLGDISDPNHSR